MSRRTRTFCVVAVVLVAVALVAGGCGKKASEKGEYYCPMHPTVTSDKPGNCPICGMKLVKRAAPAPTDAVARLARSGATTDPSLAAVSLSP